MLWTKIRGEFYPLNNMLAPEHGGILILASLLRAANILISFVLQEHEVLHDELNNQNKALLERVRELVDAGDVRDSRIRELESQVRNLQGNFNRTSYSDITL